MTRYRASCRGVILLGVILLLATLALSVFLAQSALIIGSTAKIRGETDLSHSRAAQALYQFAALYARLPCPANGALLTTDATAGYPDANASYTTSAPGTCAYRDGVVPWKALGLTESDVVDKWGRFISYRVYDGAIGLTQTGGASAVNCDTTNADTSSARGRIVIETPPTNGTCSADTNTLEASFTNHSTYATTGNNKGYIVTDYGTSVPKVAFVLIGHGTSGYGAYILRSDASVASRMTMPAATAGDYANTQASPTAFVKAAESSSSVAPGTAGHYDDVVSYIKIDELVRYAKLAARDWPEKSESQRATPVFNATTTASLGTGAVAAAGEFQASLKPSTAVAQQFQATTSSSGTAGGAVSFGSGTGAYSSCLWSPDRIDLYRAPTASVTTGTVWGSNTITFTTKAAHGMAAGNVVDITGASPAGYNNAYTVKTTPTTTTFTVDALTDPGAWVSGGVIQKTFFVKTGTSWAGNIVTFVTTANHGYAAGDIAVVTGATPAAYDGSYLILTTPTADSFTASKTSNPGTWSFGGLVTNGFKRQMVVSVQAAINSTDVGGGFTLGVLPYNGTYISASSPSTISLVPTFSITGATWSGGNATFTVSATARTTITQGGVVQITGMSPSGYNGIYTIGSVPTTTTFRVPITSNPGSFVSGGQFATTLCGASTNNRLGWENSGATNGNMPSPRFAIEVDTIYDSARNDPNDENHISVDFNGVNHGSSTASTRASFCSANSSTYHSSLLTTGTTWSNGFATFTTSSAHGLFVNDNLVISNSASINDAGSTRYNGSYAVTSVPTSTTFTAVISPRYISAASWAANFITFTTSTAHEFTVGSSIVVKGASPSAYDGLYSVASVSSTTSFTVANATNPGAWVNSGVIGIVSANPGNLITAATWAANAITFTTATAHGLGIGNAATVTGGSPSAYNGSYTVASVINSTKFTVAKPSNPGTWTATGTLQNDCYSGSSNAWLEEGITTFHKLRMEIEPRSATCNSVAPLVKFWVMPASVCNASIALAGASWSSPSTLTITTNVNHNLVAGNGLVIAGASPTAFNGTYTVLTVLNLTTLTVTKTTDPGSWSSGGAVTPLDCTNIADATSLFNPGTFHSLGAALSYCIPTPSPSNAYDSIYFGFTASSPATATTNDNFRLQELDSRLLRLQ